MTAEKNKYGKDNKQYLNIAIELILKLGALALLVWLCFRILKPFLGMLLWGLIIAIILFPVFKRLRVWTRERNNLASILIMVVTLAILVLPSIWLVGQLVHGIRFLAEHLQAGHIHIPPPSEAVAEWPLIGPWLHENWLELSKGLTPTLKKYIPEILVWGERVIGALAHTGVGILHFAVSIILAGFFLMFFERGSVTGRALFTKMAGDRGEEFLQITLVTIRNVAVGVLGVAIIQTTLMGLGLILANIHLAAIWIVIILIMTIAQIPVLIFNIFLIIFLFAFKDPLPAILWSLYFLVAGMLDNILKPMLMGKGAPVPMLVIFLGAIGGFIAFGFIGLFLGAILLSLAYILYETWVHMDSSS